MAERHDGEITAADDGGLDADLNPPWEWLGRQPRPPAPPGKVGELADRMFVYTRPSQVPVVLPVLGQRSGLIIVGPPPGKSILAPNKIDYDGDIAVDPAAYEHYLATPEKPFFLPEDGLDGLNPSLEAVLDRQLDAGSVVAMTPTGFFGAGDTDSLRAATERVRRLGRTDTIFVVALDVSLADRAFIRETAAILPDAGCPIGLVLGKQGDPLTQSQRIIPNLRNLAASVPLFPMRTDFNAFDLVAHGAFAAAIGTGGGIRHTVKPPPRPLSFNPGPAPSVLFTELICWWKGSRIHKLFGAAPRRAPRCDCVICQGQPLNRFIRKEHQNEAIGHAVAVWTRMAEDLFDAPTMRLRAEYWRNICKGSVAEHKMIATRLQQVEALSPQRPLKQWATLPAWPIGEPATPADVER